MRIKITTLVLLTITLSFAGWSALDPVTQAATSPYATIATPASNNIVVDEINGTTYIHAFVEEPENTSLTSYGIYWHAGILDRNTGVVQWSNRTCLSGITSGVLRCYPAVALDGSHNIHLTWESTEHRNPYGKFDNTELYYKKLVYTGIPGNLWSSSNPALRLTNKQMMYSGMSDIACDDEGNAHIIYMDSSADYNLWDGYHTNIIYTMVNSSGVHVTSKTRIIDDSTASYCDYPDIEVYSTEDGNYIFTAWEEQVDPTTATHVNSFYTSYLDAETSTWSTPINLTDTYGGGLNEGAFPRILVIEDNDQLTGYGVYYTRIWTPESYIYKYDLSGANWVKITLFTDPARTAVDCVMSKNNSGGYDCIYSNLLDVFDPTPPAHHDYYADLCRFVFNSSFIKTSEETIVEDSTATFSMHNLITDDQGWLHVLTNQHNVWAPAFGNYSQPISTIYYLNYDPGKELANEIAKKPNKKQLIKKNRAKLTAMKLSERTKSDIKRIIATSARKNITKFTYNYKRNSNLSRTDSSEVTISTKEHKIQELRLYPNPARDRINIDFFLPNQGTVNIVLFDLSGKTVGRISNNNYGPGRHSISWDVKKQLKGMYFCTIECGGEKIQKKFVIE